MMKQQKLPKSTFDKLAEFRYKLRNFIRFSEESARKMGITPQQHQLLLMIKGYPDREYATPAELAERLQIRHNTCLGLISRAEQSGLIHRVQNQKDQRSVWIHLTNEGEELLEQLSQIHLDELDRIGIWMNAGRDDVNG